MLQLCCDFLRLRKHSELACCLGRFEARIRHTEQSLMNIRWKFSVAVFPLRTEPLNALRPIALLKIQTWCVVTKKKQLSIWTTGHCWEALFKSVIKFLHHCLLVMTVTGMSWWLLKQKTNTFFSVPWSWLYFCSKNWHFWMLVNGIWSVLGVSWVCFNSFMT